MKNPFYLNGITTVYNTKYIKISLGDHIELASKVNISSKLVSVTIRFNEILDLEFLRSAASSVSISEERRLNATHHFVYLRGYFAPYYVPLIGYPSHIISLLNETFTYKIAF